MGWDDYLERMEFSSQLREAVRNARKVAVLTGAGISAESGVPTFRGPEGLWKKFRPEQLATRAAFEKDPALVWEWYEYRRALVRDVSPNAGHRALAEWETRVPDFTLITQNVDDLHRASGSKNVIELHGNLMKSRCLDCGLAVLCPTPSPEIPRCKSCGGLARPGVVWFGESLPKGAFEEAAARSESSDLFLSVGTSGAVYPAASLPALAKRSGSFCIEINVGLSEIATDFDEVLSGKSGEILPRLLSLLP